MFAYVIRTFAVIPLQDWHQSNSSGNNLTGFLELSQKIEPIVGL